jgi:hypothetical protein
VREARLPKAVLADSIVSSGNLAAVQIFDELKSATRKILGEGVRAEP